MAFRAICRYDEAQARYQAAGGARKLFRGTMRSVPTNGPKRRRYTYFWLMPFIRYSYIHVAEQRLGRLLVIQLYCIQQYTGPRIINN